MADVMGTMNFGYVVGAHFSIEKIASMDEKKARQYIDDLQSSIVILCRATGLAGLLIIVGVTSDNSAYVNLILSKVPENIRFIEFSFSSYDKPVHFDFPSHITKIYLGSPRSYGYIMFYNSILDFLSPALTSLTVEGPISSLDNLPPALKFLKFYGDFEICKVLELFDVYPALEQIIYNGRKYSRATKN